MSYSNSLVQYSISLEFCLLIWNFSLRLNQDMNYFLLTTVLTHAASFWLWEIFNSEIKVGLSG